MGDDTLLGRLQEVLKIGDTPRWSLTLGGEPLHELFDDLIRGLQGATGTGNNKSIETKFSYLGTVPAIDWYNACQDMFYSVMREGIANFPRQWNEILRHLNGDRYHYVSLGVGTGDKDRVILDGLFDSRRLGDGPAPKPLYVPVDLSAEMLHIGIAHAAKELRPGDRMLPIQLDFSVVDNIRELKELMQRLVGDDPIIYGFIGNTVANADDDQELLQTVAKVLRPNDHLLLEVATTASVDDKAVKLADEEYASSENYRVHATSALAQNTDLKIHTNWVEARTFVENGRALRIESHYVNRSSEHIHIRLPNRSEAVFRPDESIRVTVSRKYTERGLDDLIAGAKLVPVQPPQYASTRTGRRARPFGLALTLLRATADDEPAVPHPMDGLWSRQGHQT
jgi:L-histidine Nalpha-methyltransferase